jgi:hypothetical protein
MARANYTMKQDDPADKSPSQVEERLRHEAERRGQGEEAVALRVLDQNLPPALDARRDAAVSLLRGWAAEDESLSAEELATNVQVLKAVDEDRPSYRKLFTDLPVEIK